MRLRTVVISCVFMLAASHAHAVTYQLLFPAGYQFTDDNGTPLASGQLCTYAATTTTPLATYTDSTGGTPHANPLILDSAGRAPNSAAIWGGASAYKLVLATASGSCNSPIWSVDNVTGTAGSDLSCTGCISDSEIDASGITTRTKLPTAIAYEDQANTWTTGAQSFAAAGSLVVPISAGAAPTANGDVAYDSTAKQMEYGDDGTNRVFANLNEAQTLSNKTFSDNVTWTSGTSFNGIFDHANTAHRTYTLPDESITLVGRSNNETISGTKTFSAAPLFSTMTEASVLFAGASGVLSQENANFYYTASSDNLSVKELNAVRYAHLFAGADSCAKIAAAIADLPTTGGVVDATGFEGAQTCSTQPFGTTVPAILKLGCATWNTSVSWKPRTNQKIVGLTGGDYNDAANSCSVIAPSAGFAPTAVIDIDPATTSALLAFTTGNSVENVLIDMDDVYADNKIALRLLSVSNTDEFRNITVINQDDGNALYIGQSANAGAQVSDGLTFTNFYTLSKNSDPVTTDPIVIIEETNEVTFQGGRTKITKRSAGSPSSGTIGINIRANGGAGVNGITLDGISVAGVETGVALTRTSGATAPRNVSIRGVTFETYNVGVLLNGDGTSSVQFNTIGPGNKYHTTFGGTPRAVKLDYAANNVVIEDELAGSVSIQLTANSASNAVFALPAGVVNSGTNNVVFGRTGGALEVGAGDESAPKLAVNAAAGSTFPALSFRRAGTEKIALTLSDSYVSESLVLSAGSNIWNFSPAGNMAHNGDTDHIISVNRHPTANTAGNDLTLSAGGATSGATDKSGGTLIFQSGTATGSASSGMLFQWSLPGGAGTTDRGPTTYLDLTGVDANTPRLNFQGASTPLFRFSPSDASNGTSRLIDVLYSGESERRFSLTKAGILQWGSGSATEDVNLYRSAADVLKTEDSFTYVRHYPTSVVTFSNADTSPTVAGSTIFKTNNAGGTTITTFDDGATGQAITIIFTDANTTIAETSNIKLSAAFTSTADDTLSLVYDGTNWYETARAVN